MLGAKLGGRVTPKHKGRHIPLVTYIVQPSLTALLRPRVQCGQRETSSDLHREDLRREDMRVGQRLFPLPGKKDTRTLSLWTRPS